MRGRFKRKKRKSIFLSLISFLLVITALTLFTLNIYGLFRSLRNPDIYTEKNLLSGNNSTLDLETFKKELSRKKNESDKKYAIRINEVVQKGIAHIDWNETDVTKYHLRIPVWENYILFALSFSPFFDDFKRYHFTDYQKSIERGVGICGDAAMVLSAILEKKNINTNIIAFKGHVINEVNINRTNKTWWLFDPYLGVVMQHNLTELTENPQLAKPFYLNKGYSTDRADELVSIYKSIPDVYEDVNSFGPTKALVERLSYRLIWIIPCILLIISALLSSKNKKRRYH